MVVMVLGMMRTMMVVVMMAMTTMLTRKVLVVMKTATTLMAEMMIMVVKTMFDGGDDVEDHINKWRRASYSGRKFDSGSLKVWSSIMTQIPVDFLFTGGSSLTRWYQSSKTGTNTLGLVA